MILVGPVLMSKRVAESAPYFPPPKIGDPTLQPLTRPMPSVIPVDDLLGAAFLGIALSSVYVYPHLRGCNTQNWSCLTFFGSVYGVTCLQVYHYYTMFSDADSRRLRLFVSFANLS